MASPIGHALSGIIVYALGRRPKFNLFLFLGTSAFVLFPDIDFLFGYVIGQPNKYHHGFTHSFAFVLVTAIVTAWLLNRHNRQRFISFALMFAGAGISHVLIDILAKDNNPPYGAPIFWPISDTYYIFPVSLFSDMHRAKTSTEFFPSLFNAHNLQTVGIELTILLPILALILFFKYRKQL